MAQTLQARFVLAVVFSASTYRKVAGEGGFLRAHRDYGADFQSAMASVMGCGMPAGESVQERTDAIKRDLTPMWNTLPKNPAGNVEWHMLRYAAHRYFMQQYSILVVGLDPSKDVNGSSSGSAEILSGRGQSILDAVLKGQVGGQGFSLDDTALLVATVERAMFDADGIRLEEAYGELQLNPSESLRSNLLQPLIREYMAIWSHLVDGEPLHPERFDRDAAKMVNKMEFETYRSPRVGRGRAAMLQSFSFEDVHRAVGDLTKIQATFRHGNCQRMKRILVHMDKSSTGRVALSDFYGKNTDGVSNFAESEAYLRALGALDETSTLRGKQVIIPNYLQGASNCNVATSHYMVCCASECEEMLNGIQDAVGAPVASVEAILGWVQDMANLDDEPQALGRTVLGQLQRISQMHGGQVPLHGRLFALWLHYVFPRECPHPRKVGTASAMSLKQFQGSLASDEEVQAYSAQRNSTKERLIELEREHWISQWNDEEEGMDLGGAPWESAGSWLSLICGATAMLGAAWALTATAAKALKASSQPSANSKCKSSFV